MCKGAGAWGERLAPRSRGGFQSCLPTASMRRRVPGLSAPCAGAPRSSVCVRGPHVQAHAAPVCRAPPPRAGALWASLPHAQAQSGPACPTRRRSLVQRGVGTPRAGALWACPPHAQAQSGPVRPRPLHGTDAASPQVPRAGERLGVWGRLGVHPGVAPGRGLAGDHVCQAVGGKGTRSSGAARWGAQAPSAKSCSCGDPAACVGGSPVPAGGNAPVTRRQCPVPARRRPAS